MTLLVGIVGRDGIVLAADKRGTDFAQSEDDLDDVGVVTKIVDLPAHRFAYAFAGDYVSQLVGQALRAPLDASRGGQSNFDGWLAATANDVMRQQDQGVPRALIVVSYGAAEPARLWRLDLRTMSLATSGEFFIVGARGNGARFFGSRQFREGARSAPIEQLKVLASHIVLTAHAWDGTVDGLDVVMFKDGQSRWLTEEEKDELRVKSKSLDRTIRSRLLGH